MDIGSKIKELRIAKGLSQQQIAQRIGVNQNTFSRYENSIIHPSLEVLVLIADILEVTTDYLLGREEY